MPQSPTSVSPYVFNKAKGLNDVEGVTKIPPGFTTFAINLTAGSDVWPRRNGRSMYFLDDGNIVTNIFSTSWSDGLTVNIATMGPLIYDLTFTFTYLFGSGIRLILQSPDLNYWDCSANPLTEQINPTVIAAPSASPQAANLTVQNGESIGFTGTSQTIRLASDQDHGGWYTLSLGQTNGFTTFTDDVVFTNASGFSLIIIDYTGNHWKFSVTNDGEFKVTTV